MITGTSELNNIGLTNLYTPNIRARIRANTFVTERSVYNPPSSNSFIAGIKSGNTYMLLSSGTTSNIYSADTNNLNWSVSTRVAGTPFDGSFFYNGNSTYLYYGVSKQIYRLGLNGNTWGSTQLVYNISAANNLNGVIGVGNTQAYAIASGASLFYLKSLSLGATWGATTIYSIGDGIMGSPYAGNGTVIVGGVAYPNYDRVVLQASSSLDEGEKVQVLTIVKNKVFGNKTIMQSGYKGSLTIPNMGAGSSLNYLIYESVSYTQGVSVSRITSEHFTVSDDLINWSVPFELPQSISMRNRVVFANKNTGDLMVSTLGSTMGGGSSTSSGKFYEFYKGNSYLDVSNQIIQYSNNNNSRIRLGLGNNSYLYAGVSAPGASTITGVSVFTINLQVSASGDDSYEETNGNANSLTATTLQQNTGIRLCAMEFRGASAIKGASIMTALLSVYAGSTLVNLDTEVYAEAIDSPVNLAASDNNISSRTKTSAHTTFNQVLSTSAYTSQDIRPVIQELADRPSLGGNIMIIPTWNSDTADIAAYDLDGLNKSAKLDITFAI